MEPLMDHLLHWTTRLLEVAGIAAIVIGAVYSVYRYLSRSRTDESFHHFRSRLGRAILLGLEFLVAADIINTVAIKPTLDSVLVLGLIVLIRTFLSISLEVEIERRWPWQRRA